jgi:imidazolonepropionase-like amidohydrolase
MTHLLILAALLPPLPADAAQRPIAIRGATIWTLAGDPIEEGIILVEGGKITGVGKRLEIPMEAEIIEARGKHVIPGIIDGRSELYVGAADLKDGSKSGATLDIVDALDLFAPEGKEVLQEGITTVYVGPGNLGVVGGLGALVRTGTGPDLEEAVRKRRAALKLSLGVGRTDRTSPEWRLGYYHSLRSAFIGARKYREAHEKYRKDRAEYEKLKAEHEKKKKEAEKTKAKVDPPPKEPKEPGKSDSSEILLEAMDGKILVLIEAERTDAIRNALRLGEEFGFRWALVGGAEAAALAPEIAKAKVPVILGPVVRSPLWGVDSKIFRSELAADLSRAGVKVVIGTGGGGGRSSRYLRYQGCLAIRHGMERDAALRAITLHPAEVYGVSDRIGTLEEGKDADLVVLDGDPMRSGSRVTHVVRGGEIVRLQASSGKEF